jgi:hypothetical protein
MKKKLRKCKHFNGTVNKTCEAGVKYEDVRTSKGEGKGWSLPCYDEAAPKKCAKCELPTDEEVAAEEARWVKISEGTMMAREAIVAHAGPWKRGTPGAQGTIDCPVCSSKGTLRFTRAGVNGHIHAACSTKNCVSWME